MPAIRTISLNAAALCVAATAASADIRILPGLEYSDFFETCQVELKFEGDATDILAVYDIETPTGRILCTLDRHESGGGGSSCQGSRSNKSTCEAISAITIRGMSCLDGDSPKDCGAVSVEGDGKVALAPDAVNGPPRLVVAPLSDDGSFGSCEIGFLPTVTARSGGIAAKYVVATADHAAASECNANISYQGGVGRGCGGVFDYDYACGAITGITFTEITCTDGDDQETPCGAMTMVPLGLPNVVAK